MQCYLSLKKNNKLNIILNINRKSLISKIEFIYHRLQHLQIIFYGRFDRICILY